MDWQMRYALFQDWSTMVNYRVADGDHQKYQILSIQSGTETHWEEENEHWRLRSEVLRPWSIGLVAEGGLNWHWGKEESVLGKCH